MEDFQGGDLLAREIISPHYQFWLNYYILKKLTLFTQIPTVKNYDWLIFLLELNINKEMWLSDHFGHACSPLGIRQVIHLLGKEFSQTTPPLQGMIKLWGLVDIARSPDKLQ